VADSLSVADFAILGWAWRHPRHKVELSDFPHVERWYNALMAQPGVKRGMEAKLD
jgi:GST-like protein